MSDPTETDLADVRHRLQAAEQRINILESSESAARLRQQQLEQENDKLKRENAELSRGLPIETAVLSNEDTEQLHPVSLTFLGRDKAIFALVRKHFPHATQFVGPTSTGFKRRKPPEVLICRLENNDTGRRPLVKFIKDRRSKTAFLFYGPGAREFLRHQRKHLMGGIAEVLLEDVSDDALLYRLNAIVELRKAICSLEDTNSPLIGRSQKFIDVVTQMLRLSRFPDPVVIRSEDPAEGMSAAKEFHRRSGRHGKILILKVEELDIGSDPGELKTGDEQAIRRLFERARNGLLVASNVGLFSNKQLERLLVLANEAEQVRLICLLHRDSQNRLTKLPEALGPFMLDIPSIAQRDEDVPLFVHYFTLLHNLQVEREVYLNQAEVNQLHDKGVSNISQIKNYVFDKLREKFSGDATPGFNWERKIKTLDEYLAEFEATILSDTLKQCEGNKSKAARLLGLRPNTLHYKLSRLGIDTPTKRTKKRAADSSN